MVRRLYSIYTYYCLTASCILINYNNTIDITFVFCTEVGEKAKTILLSNRSTIKDIIVSAGLLNIIYVCEEKELITSSAKSILVSNTTGQTEDGRAYQLLDSITSVVGYSTDQMDVFLCVLYKNGGIAGKDLAKRMAEECE